MSDGCSHFAMRCECEFGGNFVKKKVTFSRPFRTVDSRIRSPILCGFVLELLKSSRRSPCHSHFSCHSISFHNSLIIKLTRVNFFAATHSVASLFQHNNSCCGSLNQFAPSTSTSSILNLAPFQASTETVYLLL